MTLISPGFLKLFLGETELENNVKMSCHNLFTSTTEV